jgi:hypothetical protein
MEGKREGGEEAEAAGRPEMQEAAGSVWGGGFVPELFSGS